MAIAAAPSYIGANFADCPPGHRFGLYFPIWSDDWQIDKKGGKTQALKACRPIPPSAKTLLAALLARQLAQASTLGDSALVLDATAIAPFATGLGLEHPVENGFAFLSPYGLPYLAGSGVKGVLRAAAQELAGEDRITAEDIEALFGMEPPPGSQDAERGALSCWDVFPDCKEMRVEIMTPHHGDYYQGKGTPNDAGQPNPIPFLAVPVGAAFRFVVTCDPRRLGEALRPRWRAAVTAIFEHACNWRGFGAKTAVGYGALRFGDPPTGTTGKNAGINLAARTVSEVWPAAKLTFNAGSREVVAIDGPRKTAPLKGAEAIERFFAELGEDRANKLRTKKELKGVTVIVDILGNQIRLQGPAS